jgi:hypothetical protein
MAGKWWCRSVWRAWEWALSRRKSRSDGEMRVDWGRPRQRSGPGPHHLPSMSQEF